MLGLHWLLRTWDQRVALYVVATEFYRRKFVEGGLPKHKLYVKPHSVYPDPGMRDRDGDYALFLGRLSPEKGVLTLCKAWRSLTGIALKIRGEGPLLETVKKFVAANALGSCVELVGRQTRQEVFGLIKRARVLVVPSEGFYETFSLVAIEAFACGVPVIASAIGAVQEIVEDGRTGLHFTPGDAENLAAKVDFAWSHPDRLRAMGRAARAEYEAKYTAETNYQKLMEIYGIARVGQRRT